MKNSLAWLNLLHDKVRTVVAVAGVAFAVILILMQLGFYFSVRGTATQIYGQMRFDLLLVSPQYLHISKSGTIPRTRLLQARDVSGVADVRPVYLGFAHWLNAWEGRRARRRGIFVMGFDLSQPVFRLPELSGDLSALKAIGNVFMDTHSRGEFGAWDVNDGKPREVSRKRIAITGKISMGTGFGADGAIVVSDRTFVQLFPFRTVNDVSLGLVQLEPGAEPEDVARQLRTRMPNDVKVFTRTQIEEHERDHWLRKTSVGAIFTLGVAIGFIVGTAIVYQVLSSDIENRMPEYATLKAMGYTSRFLAKVVLEQATILAVIGFVPGWLISATLYNILRRTAYIPMDLTLGLSLTILVATLLMCAISGLASLRKVTLADPADLF